jgi:hypothetical protein
MHFFLQTSGQLFDFQRMVVDCWPNALFVDQIDSNQKTSASSTVSGRCSVHLIWSNSKLGRNGKNRKALTQSNRFDDVPFSNSWEFQILAWHNTTILWRRLGNQMLKWCWNHFLVHFPNSRGRKEQLLCKLAGEFWTIEGVMGPSYAIGPMSAALLLALPNKIESVRKASGQHAV